MSEFEAERRMPAPAEHVYAAAADAARLNEWMPEPVAVPPAGRRDQLRLEWDGGWLQVRPGAAGTSHATLHLSVPAGPRRDDVPARIRESLDRLAVLSGSPG
ncbi:SRPBCC family protein [Amycolatopsis echigonensis]|uniref:SRPBCC family protein n=1 Tax=Amycolatopsis echigonensis TaxID=2576905 RepID=A0A8E2B6K6_9PSEU|nr:SRPBCC family protein [Amycolatopsis echigonensis]MBB2502470.1 SRPBCC family protein [Amycolatopsis echigonensis]